MTLSLILSLRFVHARVFPRVVATRQNACPLFLSKLLLGFWLSVSRSPFASCSIRSLFYWKEVKELRFSLARGNITGISTNRQTGKQVLSRLAIIVRLFFSSHASSATPIFLSLFLDAVLIMHLTYFACLFFWVVLFAGQFRGYFCRYSPAASNDAQRNFRSLMLVRRTAKSVGSHGSGGSSKGSTGKPITAQKRVGKLD